MSKNAINLNDAFGLDSLPVAPEFVETLAENVTNTAVEALENLNVPDHIIQLVRNIHELGYYLHDCYQNPNSLLKDRNARFDIEEVVIESINLIARSGGVFYGPDAVTGPRRIAAPMELGEGIKK